MTAAITSREWERFESKFCPEPNTGCWLWFGATNGNGYGIFWLRGRNIGAHRVAYLYFVGPIPDELQIDHTCRVRCCVNPEHLELVTSRENTLRGESPSANHARKTHCPAGHTLSGENLLQNQFGYRKCRECNRVRCQRKHRARVAKREQAR